MPLARTSDLVAAARDRGSAVGAFNVITLEHAEAIAAGAEQAVLPAILQISHNAVRFHRGELGAIVAATRAVAESSGVPLAVHVDHVEDLALLRSVVAVGCSSAMFDAGALPYAENVATTRAAADLAHAAGMWLEAELGFVGGKQSAPASAHTAGVRTDPDEARDYVAGTGVDALAVAVGSSHAMTTRTATLDTELIARLRTAVPVPLVLHGSSGVDDDGLRAAVRAGITKVNIGTALNLAFTAAIRTALAATDTPDPRGYLREARDAMADVVAHLLRVVSGD
jgi:fructose-bisphosphate aldolase class II